MQPHRPEKAAFAIDPIIKDAIEARPEILDNVAGILANVCVDAICHHTSKAPLLKDERSVQPRPNFPKASYFPIDFGCSLPGTASSFWCALICLSPSSSSAKPLLHRNDDGPLRDAAKDNARLE